MNGCLIEFILVIIFLFLIVYILTNSKENFNSLNNYKKDIDGKKFETRLPSLVNYRYSYRDRVKSIREKNSLGGLYEGGRLEELPLDMTPYLCNKKRNNKIFSSLRTMRY